MVDLDCFERCPRRNARNIVDTRWVITWKNKIDPITLKAKVVVKCRIAVRGFKDRCVELETYAGTATRNGQRIVNSIVAQQEDFVLFSFDISKAFAKGMTFEELARLTGEPLSGGGV